MSDYLRQFQEARRIVLPCLYLPPGTEFPRNAQFKPRDADREVKRQARKKLRVSSFTLPGVERAIAKACHFLRVPRQAVHAFVSPEIGRNAHCLMNNDEPVIEFGSALVELMTEDELACIAGHEIGHFLIPEAHLHCSADSHEARMHSRAAEITMDRIGLVACNDLQAACRAEMKMMCGLKEPHLRPDVAALLNETREAFDGTFQREEDNSHPPTPLRLRAIVEFASSDACLRAWGIAGGTPIEQVNQSITRLLHEQIDRHLIDRHLAEMTEPVLMAKAWLYCLSRSHGSTLDLATLNRFRPEVEAARVERAWASLAGFSGDQVADHAKRRFMNSLENSFAKAPQLTQQLLAFIKSEAALRSIHHLID